MGTKFKSWKIFVFCIKTLFCLVLFTSFNACKKSEEPNKPVKNIESIDIKEMAKIHLKDFSLKREGFFFGLDTQYVYISNNDEAIYIVLGIYPSQAAADSSLNQYFSEMAGVPIKGNYEGIEIGDSFWWLTGAENRATNIFFIRKNAMFMINSNKYEGLIDLAKKIDDDILTEASYVKFKN